MTEREGGVGAGPSGPSGHGERGEHRRVQSDVGQIMRPVGRNRGRAGPAHHPALHGHKAAGDRKASADQPEADLERVERHGKDESFDRLERQHEGRAREKARLGEGGHRLALAMPEAVLAIRRPLGVADAPERDDARAGVDHRIDGRGEQRDRSGDQPARQFDEDQEHRDDQRDSSGNILERGRLGRALRMVGNRSHAQAGL